MRHLFSISFVIIYVSAITQLSFLAFSDVLDDGTLTYISVGLGVLIAPILRFYQKWKHHKSADVIIEYDSETIPFHNRLLNFPLIVVYTTMGCMGFIAITNHQFAADELKTKEFKVTGAGQKSVRHDFFEYIHLSDGVIETSYNLGTETNIGYKIGDELIVKLRSGFWGYDIVEGISKKH